MTTEHRQYAPPSVDWWITSYCNLKCAFCWGPEPDSAESRELRPHVLSAIASSATPFVTLCGGEPLVVADLADVVGRLAASGKQIVLNTNGELLDEAKALELQLGTMIQVVGISIDGPDATTHERMREGASFDKTVRASQLVRDTPGARLKLATVMSAVNIDSMHAMADLVASLGPDVWRIYQYMSRGMGACNKGTFAIDRQVFEDQIQSLRSAQPSLPISASSSLESVCFIADYKGNILRPNDDGYEITGNCLTRPIDAIWKSEWTRPEQVLKNKSWLSGQEPDQPVS